MLTSWRLSQFKSVTGETVLPLAPLTVFTGANSAGKSTIIQSMLLTAQTIQSSVMARPVVLNGHMARLGSFLDIVSSGDEGKEITIGFEIQGPKDDLITMSAGRGGWRSGFFTRRGRSLEAVSVKYSFSISPGPNDDVDRDLLRLQPNLVETELKVTSRAENSVESDGLLVKRSSQSVEQRAQELKLNISRLPVVALESLKYTVSRQSRTGFRGRLEGLEIASDFVGAYLHHFVPRMLAGRFDEVEAVVAWQLALLTEPNSVRHYAITNLEESEIPPAAVSYIKNLLGSIIEGAEPAIGGYSKAHFERAILALNAGNAVMFAENMRRCLPKDLSRISALLSAEKTTLARLLRGSRLSTYDVEMQHPSEGISTGVEYVYSFFSRSVKYLGPLRDEPKPVYPLAGASDPTDVGFRGEHTAAVLDLQKKTSVYYIPSEQFSLQHPGFSPVQCSLSEAVQDWLEYMGVGTGFRTSDLGKLGHELKVQTQGSDLAHDLTQVGVGVSQVLPILVLALLADTGSTLIFEQPELHLHPRVQSRLADFFVSMTQLGKQCVVETHSEYMINRLRFRSASAEADEVARSVIIYFVEKDQGSSVYRRVRIDELGGLDVWPSGFFDESEISTAALLRQSLKKRRAKDKNG